MTSNSELTKFYKWIYNEVRNNDLASLGPFRLVKEHQSHKNIISPDQWLPKMAKMMENDKGVVMSLEDVAKDFNEMIENGDIEQYICRTNKRIALDYINEHQETFLQEQANG